MQPANDHVTEQPNKLLSEQKAFVFQIDFQEIAMDLLATAE